MKVGGVVLCGGKSSRMGVPKATLPIGNEQMLQRIVRILTGVVQPIMVIAAEGQELPPLPPDVQSARDERDGCGPLEGIHIGLNSIQPLADAAYVTSCDVPLLRPSFVKRVVQLLEDFEAVVPVEDQFHHPLAAVYRTSCAPIAQDLLAQNQFRPVFLFDRVRTRRVPIDAFRDIDPDLESLRNVNYPEEFEAIRSLILRRQESE